MRGYVPRFRISGRILVIFGFVAAFVTYCYYYTSVNNIKKSPNIINIDDERETEKEIESKTDLRVQPQFVMKPSDQMGTCPLSLRTSPADIDTVATFPQFEFQPAWMRNKEFWDHNFEDRYEKMKNDTNRPRLKVIVVPHSHNDPGWLHTFEQYFEWKTQNILNNVVTKLTEYKNMTFIWTEISFLNAWWERSHPVKRKAFKKLLKEGRLEITTGGWVMPDEACTHIYALVDQFIEGHSWVKSNLGIRPKTGWSIDPFGHGPTVPHLLGLSGLEGTIIQRIHYAWKQWLALKQIEEFHWIPGWETKDNNKLIVHNQPFDIYSIKSSCGPHPSVCLSFDFRNIPGEYSDYSIKHEDITNRNVHKKAKTLMEEYDRIGSLTAHNVALVPLGDDFRYEYPIEFDSQYLNYIKIFKYINENPAFFNADVGFGTPHDYFEAVKRRLKRIPTLKGDFFPYSDIFSEGRPAYWSGYFTTRPYVKILARQLQHHLRTAEILFTLVSNTIKQSKNPVSNTSIKLLDKHYEQLILARRNHALFQHHDAITGTSKAAVMYDYGNKLLNSIYHCLRLQESALTTILVKDEKQHTQNILQSEEEYESYGKQAKRFHVSYVDRKKIVVFNSLTEARTEVITVKANSTDVRVFDTSKKVYVSHQISPVIDVNIASGKHSISETMFDLLFVATIPPLTSITYNIENHKNKSSHAEIFCNGCIDTEKDGLGKIFNVRKLMPGDIQLENSVMKLTINRNTGLLRQIYLKETKTFNMVEMQFGAYQSVQRRSGAYLFMPDPEAPERPVLSPYSNWNTLEDDNIIIVPGNICTEITTLYLPFLIHKLRLYNIDDSPWSRGVYIENVVDFGEPPKNRETEMFMRLQTGIQNGVNPEFYTDQNGFQYQKRVKVESLKIEGNYYPITTMAWLQDDDVRLTLLTNHAQGASGSEPGRLELMMERRTLYDDFRGIGEGVVDNKLTVFQNWLLLTPRAKPNAKVDTGGQRSNQAESEAYQLPSETALYLSNSLNYPINVYIVDSSETNVPIKPIHQFVKDFPTGLHLLTLRTITDDILEQSPTTSCYMVMHSPGINCDSRSGTEWTTHFLKSSRYLGINIKNVTEVSLTGLETYKKLSGLNEIRLKPMDLKTFLINF